MKSVEFGYQPESWCKQNTEMSAGPKQPPAQVTARGGGALPQQAYAHHLVIRMLLKTNWRLNTDWRVS